MATSVKGRFPRSRISVTAVAVVLFNLAIMHERFLRQTASNFAYDASAAMLTMMSSDSVALPASSVVKIVMDVCIPLEKEWIGGHESSLYIVSNCDNVHRLLPRNQTILHEPQDQPVAHLVCILSETLGENSVLCLEEALFRDEQPTTVVFPTPHSLSPTKINHANLFPISMTSAHQSDTSLRDSNDRSTVLYHACQANLDALAVAKAIPAYAQNLVVLMECADEQRNANTTKLMHTLFPLATITTRICLENNQTAASGENCLGIMRNARHLICSSPACLFPALLSQQKVSLLLESGDELFGNATFQPNLQFVRPSSVDTLSPSSCPHRLGRGGHWHFNESYHEAHQYVDPRWIRNKLNRTENNRYIKFSWEDDHCPLPTAISNQGFCHVMQQLGFDRLFIVGDSLQFMASLALLHQLGFHYTQLDDIHTHMYAPKMRAKHMLVCQNVNLTLDIVFHRYNHIWPNYIANKKLLGDEIGQDEAVRKFVYGHKHVKTTFEVFQCLGGPQRNYPDKDGFCPWVSDYLNYSGGKTLLWANVGAHFHQLPLFEESLRGFGTFVKTHPRPDDWIVLRTLAPGHDNCATEVDPYASFEEYYKTNGNTTTFDWNLFVDYNRVMEELKNNLTATRRRQQQQQQQGITSSNNNIVASVDLHDIYWMTALRKDGHPAANDCLHYLLPGPPDWWVHTLYAMLKDRLLAQNRRKQRSNDKKGLRVHQDTIDQ